MVREAQQQLVADLPAAYLVVGSDMPGPLHSPYKRTLGRRAAGWAVSKVYKLADAPPPGGPTFASVVSGLGTKTVVLAFDRVGSGGLYAAPAGTCASNSSLCGERADQPSRLRKAFAVADMASHEFSWADSVETQDAGTNSKLVVRASAPIAAVRYCWADGTSIGLVRNAAGMPMAPFRTDAWEPRAGKPRPCAVPWHGLCTCRKVGR